MGQLERKANPAKTVWILGVQPPHALSLGNGEDTAGERQVLTNSFPRACHPRLAHSGPGPVPRALNSLHLLAAISIAGELSRSPAPQAGCSYVSIDVGTVKGRGLYRQEACICRAAVLGSLATPGRTPTLGNQTAMITLQSQTHESGC